MNIMNPDSENNSASTLEGVRLIASCVLHLQVLDQTVVLQMIVGCFIRSSNVSMGLVP